MNTVLSMSLNASLVIIFTVLARLLLKKAPKVFSYVLWIVVLFRLLCPITAQSDISLFNIVGFEPADNEIVTEVIYASFIPDTPDHVDTLTPDTVVPAVPDNDTTTESDENKDIIINYQPIIPEVNTDEDTVPTTVTVNTILRNIWLVGMSAMVIYSVLSLNMVKRKLFNAMPLKENIYVSQNILTPFVIGIIKPKIYLPVHIGEEEQRYIILHEKYHIKRFDHIAKLLFFTALVIHWFNPLVWLAFDLFTKDMEMSCDEAVMKQIGEDIKADYASSLLSLATGKSYFSPSPLAFSERDTKARIINISKWKKPKTIMIIFAAVAIMITCAMFITDPVDVSDDLAGAEYKAVKVLYDEKYTHGDYIEEVYTASLPTFHVTANKHLYVSKPDDADLWTYVGELEKSELTTKDIKGYTYVENAWVNRNDIKKITDCYIVHGEDAEFYNVFTTKNGKTYVGYGWEDVRERGQQGSDDTFFRYIYEVGSTLTKDSINYTFFDHCIECITKSEVNTFSITFAVNDFAVLGFVSGEQDNMDDMGYAVLRSHNNRTGFDMLAFRLYEGAAQTDSKIHFADPFTVSEDGTATAENTYDVILSANKNLGSTKRIMTYADGSTKEMELLSIGTVLYGSISTYQ